MTKNNDIQILDDIELESVVGGATTTKKKAVKKKVAKRKAPASGAGDGNAVTVPETAV